MAIALTPSPNIPTDQMAGIILPANVTGDLQQIIMVQAGSRRTSFFLAARKHNLLKDAQTLDIGDQRIEAYILPPRKLAPRGFWKDAGLPEWRMNDRALYIDANDTVIAQKRVDTFFKHYPDARSALQSDAVIVNRFGETILETASGRAVRTKDGQLIHHSDLPHQTGRFFIANDTESFRDCAAHVATAILRGQAFTRKELNALVLKAGIAAPLLSEFREELEAQLAARLASPNAQRALQASSLRANDNLPNGSDERTGARMLFQQYSTPFPVAAALQSALRLTADDRVLEPTFGNGTLAAYALGAGASITGIELETGRYQRASAAHPGIDLRNGDFLELEEDLLADYTCVIANPPFEKMEKPDRINIGSVEQSLTTNRLDHSIAIRALEKVEAGENGRAFIVLPADMMNPNVLSATNERFDTYARMAFDKVSVVHLEGDLYKKMGTTFPILLYAMEGKREGDDYKLLSEVAQERISELPTISEWNALFSWADDFGSQRMHQAAVHAKPRAERVSHPSTINSDTRNIQPARRRRSSDDIGSRTPSSAYPNRPNTSEPDIIEGKGSAHEPDQFDLPEVELFNDLEDDGYTMRYESRSQTAEASTVIQRSLQGLIAQALRNVELETDMTVDELVQKRLNIPNGERLTEMFSPEQIDALAMALHRKDKGKGFLNGDLMGVGKGRFLAGCTYEALINDELVIFMTEKPALFQDFFARDLAHVLNTSFEDSLDETIHLAVFNKDKAAIKSDEKIIHATKDRDLNQWKKEGIPSDINMIALSYSQFQSSSGGWKLDAIKKKIDECKQQGRKVTLLLDEAHKAAGEDSITGERATALVDAVDQVDGNVIYSSATPLKSGKNIRLYKKVLPETGMTPDQLSLIIETNPLALQEILSMEIAREGGMISREINTVNAIREFVPLTDVDEVRVAEIRESVDRAAERLSELVSLGETAKEIAISKAKRMYAGKSSNQEKMRVETTSPVSQFHHYSQYLMLAVKGAFFRDLTAQSLAAGEKVVVALENTGDALLESVIAEKIEKGHLENSAIVLDELPTIATVLKRLAETLGKARIVDGLGNKVEIVIDEMQSSIASFKDDVDQTDLSALVVTPADLLRTELEAAGIPTDEISGRKRRLQQREDGKWIIAAWSQKNRNGAVNDFNNGNIDVMFLNGSGATGISMHASPLGGSDLRPRTMIKGQLQREITNERQIEGRIGRYGQVHPPRYVIPMSGFAADDRLCQLFNRNNRNLTATSNASRENKSNISESLDLLNPVGEMVVTKYLLENMQIAGFLGLDPSISDGSLPRKLMGRLVCLPIKTQEQIMSALDSSFQMEMDALSARGINPLKLSNYDWRATVETKAVLVSGDDSSSRMGDQPIKVVSLRYQEKVLPKSYEEVQFSIESGLERWFNEQMGRTVPPSELIASEEWLKEGLLIDLAHPIFDQRMGRSKYDLLASGSKIDTEESYEILASLLQRKGIFEIHPRNQHIALKALVTLDQKDVSPPLQSNEQQILRAARQALFLNNCLSLISIGEIIAIPPELCDAFANTAIGRAAQAQNEVEGTLSMGVPAIVTSISGPKAGVDTLNLGQWHINFAVPGEEHVVSTSIASLYGAYENYLRDAEPEAFRYTFQDVVCFMTDNWKGIGLKDSDVIYGLLPDGWAARVFDRHEDTTAERFKKLFDQAPAGDVNRQRLAIVGNLFLGIKVAGKAFSEKVVFTNEQGESQHAILLKQNQKNLLAGLELQAGALPRPIGGADPITRSIALMQTYALLHDTEGVRRLHQAGNLTAPAALNATDQICAAMRDDVSDGFRQRIRERLPEILDRLARSIQSRAPSFIMMGSEPSGMDSVSPVSTEGNAGSYTGNRYSLDLTRDDAGETEALTKLASTIGDKSVMLVASKLSLDRIPQIVFSRRNKIMKERFTELAKKSQNILARCTSNRGFKIAGALNSTSNAETNFPGQSESILRTHSEVHEHMPVAYGGIRDLDVACTTIATEIVREIAQEKAFERHRQSKSDLANHGQQTENIGGMALS